jgi:PH/SEC7 domain-containing protein
MTLRLKKRGEKALERALIVSSPDDNSSNTMLTWKGHPEETIPEADEPPITPRAGPRPSPQLHRRETADAM